ncbi:hypothetical protein DES53_11163 [Roseimicrobium gellanilyticum]|uniref:Uncharacterized protein n=1 Tax=Roseimicrobium gellanilyticum TaxID=748857 RepID=A0A366HBJ5_9BACT|nr:hypothetical protein DES53_11163 [Roseimicrobium gellanilyticum]
MGPHEDNTCEQERQKNEEGQWDEDHSDGKRAEGTTHVNGLYEDMGNIVPVLLSPLPASAIFR